MTAISHTPFVFQTALGSNQYTLDQINWHPHHSVLYADALNNAASQANSGIVVTEASFQNCPSTYTTSRLLFQKSHHTYDNFFRSESLHLSATASLCASIAFVCLQAVFTQQDTQIEIMRKDTGVEKWVFTCIDNNKDLHLEAQSWHYHYQPLPELRKTLREQGTEFNLYLSMLQNDTFAHPDRWLADRSKLVCQGTAEQLTTFAALLLNFAHPLNPKPEWALESSLGLGGVSTGSVELELYLPASIGYLLEDHTY